jgi:DNA invertase Pin-like site-specific DNA recombinase
VHKLDRMFRSTTDAMETTKMFDKWGISFHSLEENLDSKSALGRVLFHLDGGTGRDRKTTDRAIQFT